MPDPLHETTAVGEGHHTGDSLVSYQDPLRKHQEGVWQHVIHCRVHAHCTVRVKTRLQSLNMVR